MSQRTRESEWAPAWPRMAGGGRHAPRRWTWVAAIVVLAVVGIGAGAAAGTVIGTGEVTGDIPVTISSALIANKPLSVNFPPSRSFFSSTSNDQSKFSLAFDISRGESLSAIIPITNRSSGKAIAELTLNIPDIPSLMEGQPGLIIEVTGSGIVTDVAKISRDSWTFSATPNMQGNASPPNGLVVKFTVTPTAIAGFFNITGRVRTVEF